MAKMKRRRHTSNKPTGQGHKLVWFTVIIIMIPVVIVGLSIFMIVLYTVGKRYEV